MAKLVSFQFPNGVTKPNNLVIFLHGYGSNGQDLLSLSPELMSVMPNTAFVSPNAIYPFEGGFDDSYQWYSLMDRRETAMLAGAKMALPIINQFIDEQLAKFSLEPSQLFLVGFSQGAMMASYVGYRRKEKIAGVISFSGYTLGSDNLENEISSKPPILLTHGEDDNVVPPLSLELANKRLKALQVDTESHLISHLGHGIDMKAIEFARKFISNNI